jgi:carbonic anhydrase
MSPAFFRCLLSVALLATSTLHAQTLDYDHQESWKAIHDSAQSPIDIPTPEAKAGDSLEPQDIRLNHASAKLDVVDNGHAVEVEAKGPEAMIRGRHFKLVQFHFHAESEHTLDGKHFPLEGHFVFRAADGRLAVVGVMYREGPANPLATKVLGALEKDGHGELSPTDISVLLPKDKAYYHYLGSLTTPPLTENVEWYVLQTPVSLAPAQIAQFRARYAHNNRKLQELNGRPLIRFPAASVAATGNRAATASR